PDHKEADDEAAGDVDEKCPVRKNRAENFRGIAADDPARISPQNCTNGYNKDVVHDGVSLTAVVVGVISPQKRTVMANSIANTFLPHRVRTSQAKARYRRARPGIPASKRVPPAPLLRAASCRRWRCIAAPCAGY